MNFSKFYNNITTRHERLIPRINSIANHLIVIYAFALPVLIQVRRASLFLLILLFILRGHYYYYFKHALKDPLIRAFVLYFIVHIIWLIGNDGSPYTKQIVHDSAFMLYPLLFFTFIDPRYVNRILFAFVLGMIFSELVSYSLSLQLLNPESFDGISGSHNNPAPVYGRTHYGFMLSIFIITLFILLSKGNLKNNIFLPLLIALLLSSINIFIAGGRTGPILLVVLFLSYVILHLKKKQAIYFLLSTLILFASFSAAYLFSPIFKNRVNETVDSIILIKSQDDYVSNLGFRLAIFESSKEILQNNWLFGVGTGNQIPLIQKIVDKNIPELQQKKHPIYNMHSEYLSALTQFGILGLLAFINILYQLFKYKSNNYLTRELFSLLAIAIFFFTFIDIFTIGLGALLISTFYVSIGLNNYITNNAKYGRLDIRQLTIYAFGVIFFQSLSYL